MPIKVPRKVPREECKKVPSVECYFVLEPQEKTECDEEPVEECIDILLEIPFLVEDEECENVPRLECAEVTEEVPIQICTNIDINRDVIIETYGETYSVDGDTPIGSFAQVVPGLPKPPDEEDEEEERRGRSLAGFDFSKIESLRNAIFNVQEKKQDKLGRNFRPKQDNLGRNFRPKTSVTKGRSRLFDRIKAHNDKRDEDDYDDYDEYNEYEDRNAFRPTTRKGNDADKSVEAMKLLMEFLKSR